MSKKAELIFTIVELVFLVAQVVFVTLYMFRVLPLMYWSISSLATVSTLVCEDIINGVIKLRNKKKE